ncbi:MAG: IS701 family transposase, partial [Nostoc sp.]
MRQGKIISNWYELQRNLFIKVAREYICENLINDSIVENS